MKTIRALLLIALVWLALPITQTRMRYVVGITLLIGTVLFLGCRKPFSGDGVMTDSGFLSYPRYNITFSSLEATNGAFRKYKFTGPPASSMTFGLVVSELGKTENIVAGLQSPQYQGLILSVEITKWDGTSVARARALANDWQMSQSSQRIMLWRDELRDVRFDQTCTYEITINIVDPDASIASPVLRPVLEGGGNETP